MSDTPAATTRGMRVAKTTRDALEAKARKAAEDVKHRVQKQQSAMRTFSLRLTEEEIAGLSNMAAGYGVGPTQFVRELVRAALEQSP